MTSANTAAPDDIFPAKRPAAAMTARLQLLRQAMRPADVTDAWRDLRTKGLLPDAVQGLARITLDHPQEEAQTIALIMRAVLEHPGKTAMLVTPDRGLAERVCAVLARWSIAVNDSGGASLATQPVGAFLRDILNAARPEAGAVAMLALLKHPFTAVGMNPAQCRVATRELEMRHWRTDRPEPSPWLDALRQKLNRLTAAWLTKRPVTDWLADHIAIAEAFAASDTAKGSERLWRDQAGEAAGEWLDDWRRAAIGFPAISGEDYRNLFTELMRTVTLRPVQGQHPRLNILGPLEARLLRAEVTILGGMNEGSWPLEPPIDPWLSRPMQKDFGLQPPDRQIGLAAHDFVQFACGPTVFLTRARRVGTAPAVPSRFLLQLDTVLNAAGLSHAGHDALRPNLPWQTWAQALDHPDRQIMIDRPEPKPPVAARPKKLSVTRIATWQRNPYAIYAEYILALRPLPELDAAIDASDRGMMIHAALERFVTTYPDKLPPQPEALRALIDIGQEIFAPFIDLPEVAAFWWPRFEKIAAWFVANEMERRDAGIKPALVEASGNMLIGAFALTGRVDRIDALPDQTLAIIDYKTGAAPSEKAVKAGAEPQLPLLALIAQAGGFKNLAPAQVKQLAYWSLSGTQEIRGERAIDLVDATVIDAARTALEELIAAYADPAMPYRAAPNPRLAPAYDEYAHLARRAEWGRVRGGE